MNACSYDAFLARAVDAHMASNDEADELAYELALDDAKNQAVAAIEASELMGEDVAELAIRLANAKTVAERASVASDFAKAVLVNFERALDRIAQDTAENFLDEAIDKLNERAAP